MVRKEILPTSTNSTFSTLHSTFEYLWDGWNIIRETTTNLSTFQPFNFSTSYVWGLDLDGTLQGAGGVGGLLAVIQAEAVPTNSPTPNSSTHKLFLPAYDANGNITEYAATNGTVAAHYEYSAFGEPIVSDDELASSFAHQFSTKPYCNITDFSEYVYRKYRPDVGRWMSRDPIGDILFRKHMGHAIRAKSREDNRTWYENVIAQDNPYRYDSLANGYDILGLFPAEDILACVQRCLEMSRHVPGITKFAENCINACDYNPYNVPTIPDLLTPPPTPPSWKYCDNRGNWEKFLEILKAFWKGFREGLWD
jgi:RHS repeat-associated protein